MYQYLLDYARSNPDCVCEVAFASGTEMRKFIKQCFKDFPNDARWAEKHDHFLLNNLSIIRFRTYPSEMSSRGVVRDTLLVCGITDEKILANLRRRTNVYFIQKM